MQQIIIDEELSGKVNIDKIELEKLSAETSEEMKAVAADIESGAYKEKKAAA